jgi:hypothetical protein
MHDVIRMEKGENKGKAGKFLSILVRFSFFSLEHKGTNYLLFIFNEKKMKNLKVKSSSC